MRQKPISYLLPVINTLQSNKVSPTSQKQLGCSLAYGNNDGDNDGNNVRENFMGSRATHGVNNDEGYITADVFGSVLLVE